VCERGVSEGPPSKRDRARRLRHGDGAGLPCHRRRVIVTANAASIAPCTPARTQPLPAKLLVQQAHDNQHAREQHEGPLLCAVVEDHPAAQPQEQEPEEMNPVLFRLCKTQQMGNALV
jgi:hypothetical protein